MKKKHEKIRVPVIRTFKSDTSKSWVAIKRCGMKRSRGEVTRSSARLINMPKITNPVTSLQNDVIDGEYI